MKTYAEKLKDPRWQRKRLEILNRDEFTCRDCGDKSSTLHIHHCIYHHGKEPWEYGEWDLRTLCEECHSTRHDVEKQAKANFAFIMSAMPQRDIHRLTIEILHCIAIGETPRAVEQSFLTSEQLEAVERSISEP